ncbi:MAG: hypothetical protein ACYC96_16200 [Fimbriimonadaceae bacterium]
MNTNPILKLRLLGAIVVFLPVLAAAVPRYRVIDLGVLPGFADSYVWEGTLNNRDEVGMYANNAANPNAFVGDASYLRSRYGDVDLLPGLNGATDTVVLGLNDRGVAVGSSGAMAFVTAHAARWEHGHVTDLGTLADDIGSDANFVTDDALIVGDSYSASATRAAVWAGPLLTALPTPVAGSPYVTALGANIRGTIVGYFASPGYSSYDAAVWRPHEESYRVKVLPRLPSSLADGALAINDRGEVVGFWQTAAGDFRGILWRGGHPIDLGNIGSDINGEALSINSHGAIVGFSSPTFGVVNVTTSHAWLWSNGSLVDLQTLIAANSGWLLQQAETINDEGEITGIGLHNGQIRGYLLEPRDDAGP